MANFIDTNINQTVLMDINYLDQLSKNTFEFYLYTLLNREHMLDAFLLNYKNKNAGRKAYPLSTLTFLQMMRTSKYMDAIQLVD